MGPSYDMHRMEVEASYEANKKPTSFDSERTLSRTGIAIVAGCLAVVLPFIATFAQ